MIKKLFFATLIAILLAGFALPALAKPPDHFSEIYQESPNMATDCGDFQIWTTGGLFTWEGTIHYDQEGNPIRVITHWWGQDTVWNTNNEKEISVDIKFLNSFDLLDTGETIGVGIQGRFTVPGEGTLVIDAGRLVFDPFPDIVFAAGRHPMWLPDEGDYDKLCAYFAE